MFTRDPNSHPRPLPAPAPATSTRESRPATFRHTRMGMIDVSTCIMVNRKFLNKQLKDKK